MKTESMLARIALTAAALSLTGCNSHIQTVQQNPNGRIEFSKINDPELIGKARPNDATISYARQRKDEWTKQELRRGNFYEISPAGNAVKFDTVDNPKSESLTRELAEGYILSYLYYDNGSLVYDGVAAAGRFSVDIDDKSTFFTHSTGKSIVSYLIGHAICDGYIDSVDEPVDWPMMSETLYQGQPLRNLLDMRAGDAHLYDEDTNRLLSAPKQPHHRHMGLDTMADLLNGTEPKGNSYHYNNALTDIIASYLAYKTGEDYDEFIRTVFQDRIKIQNKVLFQLHPKTHTNRKRSPYFGDMQTRASYSFQITRKDLLRVAITMLSDYQSGNCVGQYLKDLQERAKRHSHYGKTPTFLHNLSKKYGGQIYWDFEGMRGRNILGTDGNNGQYMLIDLDSARVLVVNSASQMYDTRHFILNPIKTGELPK